MGPDLKLLQFFETKKSLDQNLCRDEGWSVLGRVVPTLE